MMVDLRNPIEIDEKIVDQFPLHLFRLLRSLSWT